MRFMWIKKNSPMQPRYYTMAYVVQKIDDDDYELYESSFFRTISLTVK